MITALVKTARSQIAKVNPGEVFFRWIGVMIAVSGLAHFATPTLFNWISKSFFPEDTETWVRVNGAAETAIGVAIAEPKTRTWGIIGLCGYSLYLGDRVVADVRRRIGGTRR